MKLESWTRYLVAAALVLLIGAVWALAEETEMKVEVRSEGGQEITVDINGVTETVRLDDLKEGEERAFDVGEHQIVIKRVGDELELVQEGLETGALHHLGEGDADLVWVTAGDDCEHPCKRVMIMKHGEGGEVDVDADAILVGEGDLGDHDVFIVRGKEGEIDVEALKEKYGEDFEELRTAHGAHVMKWVDEGDGEHPIIIKRMGHHGGGDYVTYRCEETGSTLTVKADENLLDDYIDPVTGCVMKKVESDGVRVIEIRKEIINEEEDE